MELLRGAGWVEGTTLGAKYKSAWSATVAVHSQDKCLHPKKQGLQDVLTGIPGVHMQHNAHHLPEFRYD
jgi:hypothetical protein